MLKCIVQAANGNDDFYLVIFKKEIAFFKKLGVFSPFLLSEITQLHAAMCVLEECIYKINTIISLRIL